MATHRIHQPQTRIKPHDPIELERIVVEALDNGEYGDAQLAIFLLRDIFSYTQPRGWIQLGTGRTMSPEAVRFGTWMLLIHVYEGVPPSLSGAAFDRRGELCSITRMNRIVEMMQARALLGGDE